MNGVCTLDLPAEAKAIEREVIAKLQAKKLDVNFEITCFSNVAVHYNLSSKNPDMKVPKEAQHIVDTYFRDLRDEKIRLNRDASLRL